MVRMVVNACLIVVMSIVMVLPVTRIDQATPMPNQSQAEGSKFCFVDRVETDLRVVQVAASALTEAAITGIRTVICLGEATIDAYRVLSGPPARSGRA